MKIKTNTTMQWLIYRPESVDFDDENIIDLCNQTPEEILREHHRSQVKKVKFQENLYVVKTPRNKNRSFWIRITTLYRDSEVVRDLKSQLLLRFLNINTVEPIAALEKRKFGMVVDSRIIYKFRQGSELLFEHYPQMISIMKRLHQNGYIHDDPHIKNFLQHKNQVFVIDCKPRNNLFGDLGIAHNNITLVRRTPDKSTIYSLIGVSPKTSKLYKLVDVYIDIDRVRREIKNKLRKIIGINHKNRD